MRTDLTIKIHLVWTRTRQHLADRLEAMRREPDAGYTTETVVITALLVLMGIAALGILAAKVADKANSLNF
ncbi:hypothetical protein [Kitasatospora sp. NBC_01266]|uniref:hypothetical protein n=1 Tax=Kitasatospora sp. NBC_01266 TaxID=2903572 RepID=UPI002E381F65|nr:hypothetical protein [Kitasatospora sp. NBC_01266]